MKGFERSRGLFRVQGYIINVLLTPEKGGELLVIVGRRGVRRSAEGSLSIVINVEHGRSQRGFATAPLFIDGYKGVVSTLRKALLYTYHATLSTS
jgi:hypothetical protein